MHTFVGNGQQRVVTFAIAPIRGLLQLGFGYAGKEVLSNEKGNGDWAAIPPVDAVIDADLQLGLWGEERLLSFEVFSNYLLLVFSCKSVQISSGTTVSSLGMRLVSNR